MKSNFKENLKKLTDKYTQKVVAEQTGFSQSSINNYLTKDSEPSIQFLIALKDAFGVNVDDFLFAELQNETQQNYDKYVGNYLIYYYNNDSYKGEVHTDINNTLNYGVLSIYKHNALDKNVSVIATFLKKQVDAVKLLRDVKKNKELLEDLHKQYKNCYLGELDINDKNIFISLENKEYYDKSLIILNAPPSYAKYLGGIGTVNSIARGREHNPCVQFIIVSKTILDIPEGELYDNLKLSDFVVDLEDNAKDVIELFKRLYINHNELSAELSDIQKTAIIKNRLDLLLSDVFEANALRFAKISNRDDDNVYRIIKEGFDV